MNNRIKCTLLLFLFIVTSITRAQQVYIEAGLGSAFFEDYISNKGENTLDESYSQSKRPFFEGGFRFNLYKERIKLDIGTNYSTYKMNTALLYRNTRVPLTYDLSYLAVKVGFNLSVIQWKRFTAQLHFHISHDWLTAGTNRVTDTGIFVDIYKERSLDRTLLRFHRGFALEYEISKNISTYLNYNTGNSIQEENQDDMEGESYSFETKSISFGLLFNISKNNKKIKNTLKNKKAFISLNQKNKEKK